MAHANHKNPVRISVVRGEPITVYGRTLTPVAKVVSGGGHTGTVRESHVEGYGWAFARIKPSHLAEERDGDISTIPIPDATSETLYKLAILAIVVTIVSMIFVLIGHVKRA